MSQRQHCVTRTGDGTYAEYPCRPTSNTAPGFDSAKLPPRQMLGVSALTPAWNGKCSILNRQGVCSCLSLVMMAALWQSAVSTRMGRGGLVVSCELCASSNGEPITASNYLEETGNGLPHCGVHRRPSTSVGASQSDSGILMVIASRSRRVACPPPRRCGESTWG